MSHEIRHKREVKKPKGTKPGSRKGQRRQGVSDKIKQAKEEGHAWLSHPGAYGEHDTMWRIKIEPPSEDNIPKYFYRGPCWAFLRCKTQGIGLFEIHDYKGERLVAFVGGRRSDYEWPYTALRSGNARDIYRTIDEGDILAIVTEKHERPQEESDEEKEY